MRAAKRLVAVAALASLLQPQLGGAQAPQEGPKLNVIRDAEIEDLLRDYTRPILKAAKLGGQNVEVVLIGDRAFNAFVADGRRIFVNIGALYEAETPNQVIGVLAHETGHIAGGHLARLRDQISNAQTASIVAMLLALGAAVGGAATNAPGVGQALPGLMMGPQEMIRRSLLSYVRQQEEAADRAAVNFLNATGQSTKGMLETFKRFADQTMFLSRSVDPYTLTHPMPRDRIAVLENLARESPYYDRKDSPQLQLRHEMMRAKLSGFIDRQDVVLRRYPPTNNSLPARYARAIAASRFGNVRDAVTSVDSLIAEHPDNAYFHELKGQILLESARAKDAIVPLRRAVAASHGSPLIRMMLGQALVQSGDPAVAEEAVAELRQALAKEPNAPLGYRQLAIALGRKGDRASADLASAQASFNEGDFNTARQLAARAQRVMPKGTPGWLKADDIVNYKPPKIGQN
ncbi:MAG TPA: M48 family metalloprotease [Xanthobacteraceae bacterium]|jgi:predicted Zn-dependent protease